MPSALLTAKVGLSALCFGAPPIIVLATCVSPPHRGGWGSVELQGYGRADCLRQALLIAELSDSFAVLYAGRGHGYSFAGTAQPQHGQDSGPQHLARAQNPIDAAPIGLSVSTTPEELARYAGSGFSRPQERDFH
jgi:hypothetical protein